MRGVAVLGPFRGVTQSPLNEEREGAATCGASAAASDFVSTNLYEHSREQAEGRHLWERGHQCVGGQRHGPGDFRQENGAYVTLKQ